MLFLVESFEGVNKRRRVVWARNWLRRLEDRGAFHQLVRELECKDDVAFAEYFLLLWNE